MKNPLIKALSLVIALCFVLPLIVACGGNTTETSTEKQESTEEENTAKESESESVTESVTEPPEEYETNDRGPDSVCYIGEDAIDPDARFFDSLEEAVAANPDGAVLKLCTDLSIDDVFHFPDTAEYVLDFNGYDADIVFDSGVAMEYWMGAGAFLICSNRLSAITERYERYLIPEYQPKLWVFDETNGLAVGRYNVVNENEGVEGAEPEYRYDLFEDLSGWGRKYVAYAGWGGKTYFFYTIQEGIDGAKSDHSVIDVHILRDCAAVSEDGLLVIPASSYTYLVGYAYHYVDARFASGMTYDDTHGGYCFYSSLEFLSSRASLNDTYCWIWSDEDGYVPGKYFITANAEGLDASADKWDPETGLYYVMHVGPYVYTRMEDVSLDEFFEEMRVNVYGGD